MKLIKISAMWCSACIIMKNIISESASKYGLELTELDYDFDDISAYEVGKILPVLMIEKDGEIIAKLVGEKKKEEIEKFIEGCL